MLNKRLVVIQYMIGVAVSWLMYWLVGEDITSLLFFATTVVLWICGRRPSMIKIQQKILKPHCDFRIITGGETATRTPALIIELAFVGATAVFLHVIGYSMVPAVFMLALTLYIHMFIETKMAEIEYLGFIPTHLEV